MLTDEILELELRRLELSVQMLQESNAILVDEEDEDCRCAYHENVLVIET
jgi:hypothetical protein